jgi:hypothetical protein
MNKLPQELVDRISNYLDYDSLKKTLFLSRCFQYAAEQYSGAFSKFDLTEENADEFLKTYSGRRFRYLQDVKFATSVSSLESDGKDDEESCRDTVEELKSIDQEFTRQIHFLFSTLKTLESDLDSANSSGKIHLLIFTPTRAIDYNHFCLHRAFVSWRVHLLAPSTLPTLSSVRYLTIETSDEYDFTVKGFENYPDPALRKIDLRVLIDVSHRLTNLENLQCKIGGDEWFSGQGAEAEDIEAANLIRKDWEGPRRDSRHDFAKAVQDAALPCLRHAQLDFIYPIDESDWIDQRRSMPNLTQPATYDPFSTSLRILSYQLRTMKLRVVADKTLFWPANSSTPSWPNLESVSVMFHMVTPAGTWYFEGLPGVGASEGYEITEQSYPPLETTETDESSDFYISDYYNWGEHRVVAQYRVRPNNETLVPFLTAFAKGAALMPSLKEVTLWCPLEFSTENTHLSNGYEDFDVSQVSKYQGELAWGVGYTKPSTRAFTDKPGEDFAPLRQLWWKVGKWRPDPELHNLFQKIGRSEHGEDLAEYWDDEWSGDGLVGRDEFEIFEGRIFGY